MERTILLMASVRNNRSIPSELFAEFQTSFYNDTRDAAFKALVLERELPFMTSTDYVSDK